MARCLSNGMPGAVEEGGEYEEEEEEEEEEERWAKGPTAVLWLDTCLIFKVRAAHECSVGPHSSSFLVVLKYLKCSPFSSPLQSIIGCMGAWVAWPYGMGELLDGWTVERQ